MKGMDRRSSWAKYLVKKHLLPVPRFDAAWPLAQTRKLNSMIDSSDGLAASVRFIGEMSGLSAHVDLERLPLSPELKALAAKDRSVDRVQMALNGGEDYELVFTVPPRHLKALQKRVPGITPVGFMTKGKGVRYCRGGKEQRITGTGFQHFHE
jgi:thiamine-monophosphate kinase